MAKRKVDPDRSTRREATSTGCLLALVSVVITVWLCLAIGARLFIWIMSLLPNEDMMDFKAVRLLVGIVVYGALICPGLFIFWVGEQILSACGIAVWREADDVGEPDG